VRFSRNSGLKISHRSANRVLSLHEFSKIHAFTNSLSAHPHEEKSSFTQLEKRRMRERTRDFFRSNAKCFKCDQIGSGEKRCECYISRMWFFYFLFFLFFAPSHASVGIIIFPSLLMTESTQPCTQCEKLQQALIQQQLMLSHLIETVTKHEISISFLWGQSNGQQEVIMGLGSKVGAIASQVSTHHICIGNTMTAVQSLCSTRNDDLPINLGHAAK
jgi:hypothetical protein